MEYIGYGFTDVYEELSVPNILLRVPEASLWRYYLGTDYQIGKDICSPLRKDKNPSFNIYRDRRDRIMFKDHGGSGEAGDIVDFIRLKERLDFSEALIRINSDFSLGLGIPAQQTYKGCRGISTKVEKQLDKFEEKFSVGNSAHIRVWTRPYTQPDIEYWNSYGVSRRTLVLYDVHCIERLELNGGLVYTHSTDNPGYVYHFPMSKHNKCYFPFGKRRFLSSANNYQDIQGYQQCNIKAGNCKVLILTKSMKDVMCLRGLGYDAMAIHGETQYFYKDFIRHVRKYCPRIISLYDRDKAGVKGARHLWREHKISPYFINKSLAKLGMKDVSDMYKAIGRGKTEEFMKEIVGF